MNDFRKKMHIGFKQRLVSIITQFLGDLDENIEEFAKDPEKYIVDWVNANCLPMGDFDKEAAIKEIEGWSE